MSEKQRFTERVLSMHPSDNLHEKAEQFRVHSVRNLTDSAYVLRFDRNNMQFLPGQHLTLGLFGDNQVREYSIYSTIHDPFLEVLIKEVENGLVSKKLKKVKTGDLLNVDGPFGFFTVDDEKLDQGNFLFIATGTGIAPFHSITGSLPDVSYTLLHGVRTAPDGYEKNYYRGKHVLCCSREKSGNFQGRVTEYLKANQTPKDAQVYLCGNCDMIYEVYDLLTSQGISSDQIKTEVYF